MCGTKSFEKSINYLPCREGAIFTNLSNRNSDPKISKIIPNSSAEKLVSISGIRISILSPSKCFFALNLQKMAEGGV